VRTCVTVSPSPSTLPHVVCVVTAAHVHTLCTHAPCFTMVREVASGIWQVRLKTNLEWFSVRKVWRAHASLLAGTRASRSGVALSLQRERRLTSVCLPVRGVSSLLWLRIFAPERAHASGKWVLYHPPTMPCRSSFVSAPSPAPALNSHAFERI
jgi:hypothetical protein